MKKRGTVLLALALFLFSAGSLLAGDMKKTPDIVTLDTLVDKYEAVLFTHERHVTYAGNCATCHHEHENFGAFPCKDCHSVSPSLFKKEVTRNFMSCKNCHSVPDPATPGTPSLKVAYHNQCFQCHKGMGKVGVDPKGCAELCHAKREQAASMKQEKP